MTVGSAPVVVYVSSRVLAADLLVRSLIVAREFRVVARQTAQTEKYANCEGRQNNSKYVTQRPTVLFRRLPFKHPIGEEEDIEKGCEESVNSGKVSKHQEVLVVAFADTRSDPGTVVVVDFDASFAVAAVE